MRVMKSTREFEIIVIDFVRIRIQNLFTSTISPKLIVVKLLEITKLCQNLCDKNM